MSLPAAIDYRFDHTHTTVGGSRATWQLEPHRAAVLVHDLQHYFLRPYAPTCPALVDTLDGTAAILAAAREHGVPVFYTAQTGRRSAVVRGLQADLWGPGMEPVPEHTDIPAQVAPGPDDTVLVKHRYSAFAHSDLAERLAALGRDQLVITGVYAHIGVTATAFDAFMQEVHPFVVADAVADFGPVQHRRALDQVASCAGVVTSTDRVLAAFTGPAAHRSPTAPPTTEEPSVSVLPPAHRPGVVRAALAAALDPEFADTAFAAPDADLFALGLNSLQAFDVLDRIVDAGGPDLDYADFTGDPTVQFLTTAGVARDGAPA